MLSCERVRAYLGIGSNLGDRAAHLAFARVALAAAPGVRVVACSGVYETRPLDCTGGAFFNQVLSVETDRSPRSLLSLLLEIERARGRERGDVAAGGPVEGPPAGDRGPVGPAGAAGLDDGADGVEGARGRPRWRARPLDLDLLYASVGGRPVRRDGPDLVLPHPRLAERDFVLVPLREVAPGLRLAGRTLGELLEALDAGRRSVLRRVDRGASPP